MALPQYALGKLILEYKENSRFAKINMDTS